MAARLSWRTGRRASALVLNSWFTADSAELIRCRQNSAVWLAARPVRFGARVATRTATGGGLACAPRPSPCVSSRSSPSSSLASWACSAGCSTSYRQTLYAEKQDATRKTVEVAYSVVEHFAAQARRGTLPVPRTPSAHAIATLKHLRYDKDNYVWVNDLEPRMVMHPFKPELDGKDLSSNADPTGKKLFVEMAAVCRRRVRAPSTTCGRSRATTRPSRRSRT